MLSAKTQSRFRGDLDGGFLPTDEDHIYGSNFESSKETNFLKVIVD